MPRKNSRVIIAATILLLLVGVVAFANKSAPIRAALEQSSTNSRPLIKETLSGTVERAEGNVPVDKAGAVKPGELLQFTINSVNEGASPAHKYRATGQIPKGTIYVEESARGENQPEVSYSIDGGKSFSPRPMIEEKQPDGSTKAVPAPASMYTQVRFQWAQPLAAGNRVSASYRVRVK